MPRVLDTTLAFKDFNYPAGWLWKGQFWNHNNMDEVALFHYGWTQASSAKQKAMAAEIDRLLTLVFARLSAARWIVQGEHRRRRTRRCRVLRRVLSGPCRIL